MQSTTSLSTVIISTVVAAVLFGAGGWFLSKSGNAMKKHDHQHNAQDCRGKNCTITVTFDCDDPQKPTQDTCIPYPDLEAVLLTSKDKFSFKIDNKFTYKLDSNDGVRFISGFPTPPASNFPCAYNQGNGGFICSVAEQTPPGLYKYSIHVIGFDTVDPWVVNN